MLDPVTDGYHTRLPLLGGRVLVWGNHTSPVNTAMTWLEKRGISAIDHVKLVESMDESALRRTRALRDEATMLRGARFVGVDEVVFVTYAGDVRAPMVSIRG
ncbi:MAG TPA: hypothetical protein VJ692_05990 [Nitrospiraceae bacterium]|nr:hypothetical protein [Nitrospiraceae bacterium]